MSALRLELGWFGAVGGAVKAVAAVAVGLTIALAASALAGCSRPPPAAEAAPASPADPVAITLDTHSDIPLDFATAGVDPLDADLQNSLAKMRSGGLDAAFFIVYVGQTARTPENYAQAQADATTKFDAIHRMAEVLHPDLIEIAYRADDLARIAASGKLVAAIGIENGYVLGKDLEQLDNAYERGARYITLVHNGDNDLARSAQPRPELGDGALDTGVTATGATLIERMNRLGIMVDVSHGSKQTALDAMRLSRAPVIASHSSVASVTAHARNMDDETLLALRDDGGVIQVVAFDSYLRVQSEDELAALRELRDETGLSAGGGGLAALSPEQRTVYDAGLLDIQSRWPASTVSSFVDHIDYAVKLIGIDHVGISSDFGGGGGVDGWRDASETRNVTTELEARGYSREDIAKIWSGNLLRVWRETERVAAEIAATR